MKQMYYEDSLIYIGEAEEIEAEYNCLYNNDEYHPMYSSFPVFNPEKIYGIEVTADNDFCIISEHSMCNIILHMDVKDFHDSCALFPSYTYLEIKTKIISNGYDFSSSTPFCDVFTKDYEDTTYFVTIYFDDDEKTDGRIIFSRCGNGKGCFTVNDCEYNSFAKFMQD